jgi:hypothetical protein
LKKAAPCGLRIYADHKVTIGPDVDGTMHDPFDGAVPWRRGVRSWDSKKHGKPKVHNSVANRSLDNQNKPNSSYDPWILQIPHDVV